MTVRLWRLLLVALTGAVIGGGSVGSIAAQSTGGALELADLEGVEQVVRRTYAVDFESLMATPGASSDPASLVTEGMITLRATVAEFDESANAQLGWELFTAALQNQGGDATGVGGAQYLAIEPGDIGDNASAFTATVVQEGTELFAALYLIQDGVLLYTVLGIAAAEDPVAPTAAFVEALVDADVGDDGVELGDDGSYSGGLWDKFPEQGDETAGLAPESDELILGAIDAATPEA